MFLVWWHWVVAGLVLAGFEALVPGYIFVGFSAGAIATGLLVAVFGAFADRAVLILIFAVLSLAAWLVLRYRFRVGEGPKIWRRDINDD